MTRFTRMVILLLPLLLVGCAGKSHLPKDAEFPARLAGIWRGELQLENSEQQRRWKKKRRGDGALVINIGLYDKDGSYLGREVYSGFWWVAGKLYFEKFPGMDYLVIPHELEWTGEGLPKFTAYTSDGTTSKPVTFIETKVGEGE